MTRRRIRNPVVWVLLALLALCVLGGCVTQPSGGDGGGGRGETESLRPAEVREYRGAKLSSIEDFRENSIKGPQEVDTDTYRLKIGGR